MGNMSELVATTSGSEFQVSEVVGLSPRRIDANGEHKGYRLSSVSGTLPTQLSRLSRVSRFSIKAATWLSGTLPTQVGARPGTPLPPP